MPKDLCSLGEPELAIPGIGKDLAGKDPAGSQKARVDSTGIDKEIPAGLLAVLRVPGIGPKTAKMLYDKRKVKSLEELETLARGKKLAGLPGIQEKTEENILKGIDLLKKGRMRAPLGKVLPLARNIVERLQKAVPTGNSRWPAACGGGRRRSRTSTSWPPESIATNSRRPSPASRWSRKFWSRERRNAPSSPRRGSRWTCGSWRRTLSGRLSSISPEPKRTA
jgi:hypothetical protein